MKSSLKYFLFASLFFVISCGNTAVEKEKTVATASPATKPIVAETPKPIVEDMPAKKVMEKTTKVAKTATPAPVKTAEKVVKEAVKKTKEVVKTKVETPAPKVKEIVTKVEVPKEAPKKVEPPKVEAPQKEVVAETPKATTPAVKTPTPTPKKEVVKPTPKPVAFSHAAWNTLAQKHISAAGKVNYKGFKADAAAFDAYLKSLAANPVQSSWSRGQKMAYWINAYNAFTIKLIVDNYPVKSIMDLNGGKPWDRKWIKLGGKTYSLNNIEHDILRPQFKDARIHFAVNCAAKSCPPVWNKAWTAANLNGQLERSAKAFINNANYNNVGGSNAAISKIFEWYAVDFGDNITTYLNKYASTKVDAGTAVTYKDYNWALNE